jgi:hypothetical protein
VNAEAGGHLVFIGERSSLTGCEHSVSKGALSGGRATGVVRGKRCGFHEEVLASFVG